MLRVVRRPTTSELVIEIFLGEVRLVVRAGFDAALLRQLVAALGGAS